MTERDMRAVALGMAVGAAVGAAVALLLAPKRGAELRDDVVRSFAKVGRAVAGGVTKVRASASSVLTRAKLLVGAALTPAGVGRADDSDDLDARSQDMVAEGGPDGA
jgi:gas vesicle protein